MTRNIPKKGEKVSDSRYPVHYDSGNTRRTITITDTPDTCILMNAMANAILYLQDKYTFEECKNRADLFYEIDSLARILLGLVQTELEEAQANKFSLLSKGQTHHWYKALLIHKIWDLRRNEYLGFNAFKPEFCVQMEKVEPFLEKHLPEDTVRVIKIQATMHDQDRI